MKQNIIVERIDQGPGQYQSPSDDYRGKRFRTIMFLEDYKTAQFQEINGQLILDWKAHQLVTSENGNNYCSLNLGLPHYSFMVAYHDHENITADDFFEQ